ncbi:MAG: hypothetical protein CMQ16_04600 [Gammaproteobacteria bacterium]|nr:hypothetical protein [Gammaproteobacteria bacterium]
MGYLFLRHVKSVLLLLILSTFMIVVGVRPALLRDIENSPVDHTRVVCSMAVGSDGGFMVVWVGTRVGSGVAESGKSAAGKTIPRAGFKPAGHNSDRVTKA